MPERYRVAIVTRTFPPRGGGIASAHYNLFKLLSSAHEVRAFAFDDDDTAPVADAVRRKSSRLPAALLSAAVSRFVRRRDQTAEPVYTKAIASAIPAARALSGPLRRFKPDIVIVPDNSVPALAMQFPPGASVIWMSRNNYKRFENQPLVNKRSWMDIHLAHRLELRGLKKAHHVICPSHYMKRVFRETYSLDLPVDVIYNFVHRDTLGSVVAADLRNTLGVSSDHRLIYIPSAGSSIKGARYVFEIVRRLAQDGNVAFYLSGNIARDLAAELESLKGRVPIFAPGHLPYSENLRYAAACDLTVSPTLIENLSNAIVEALMLGMPVVTFDTGGNSEVVHSGVNGFVVPYIDVDALIARSDELIHDSARLREFKSNTKIPLAALTDEDMIRGQYQKVFDSLRK